MNLEIKSRLPSAVRFTVTSLLVFALVFGLIWALTQWAKYEPPIEPDPEGTISLTSTAAQVHGSPKIRLESFAGEKTLGYWDFDTQWVTWDATIPKADNYTVSLRYARPGKPSVGLSLKIGDNTLTAPAPGTGGWDKWVDIELGTIQISQLGKQKITLKTLAPPSEGVINLVHLKLTPVR